MGPEWGRGAGNVISSFSARGVYLHHLVYLPHDPQRRFYLFFPLTDEDTEAPEIRHLAGAWHNLDSKKPPDSRPRSHLLRDIGRREFLLYASRWKSGRA